MTFEYLLRRPLIRGSPCCVLLEAAKTCERSVRYVVLRARIVSVCAFVEFVEFSKKLFEFASLINMCRSIL